MVSHMRFSPEKGHLFSQEGQLQGGPLCHSRVVGNYYRLYSISGMMQSLGWSTLEDRRREVHLTLFHEIVTGEIAVSDDIQLELADRQTRSTHKYKYKTKSASTSHLTNFVTHKTIKDWNALPASVVDTDSTAHVGIRASSLVSYVWGRMPTKPHAPSLSLHRYFILPEEAYRLNIPWNNGRESVTHAICCIKIVLESNAWGSV